MLQSSAMLSGAFPSPHYARFSAPFLGRQQQHDHVFFVLFLRQTLSL